MLLQDPDLPVAILEILLPELPKAGAAVIARPNIRRQQDAPAQFAQAIVVFIILIPHQLFVERAYPLDHFAAVSREWDRIGKRRVRCAYTKS